MPDTCIDCGVEIATIPPQKHTCQDGTVIDLPRALEFEDGKLRCWPCSEKDEPTEVLPPNAPTYRVTFLD